ncbi:MAG: hypothetical protein JKX92_12360 [Porticoccaceae bacterium]|nr:hypothetical protein [Porticoccaceae bacterium]
MPEVTLGSVPAHEAITHIREKLAIPTTRWNDLMGDVQAKAFTVAGATKMDLLDDFHQAVISSIENGSTLGDFRKDFDTVVADHGWSYKGSRGWRSSLIFNTNLRTAHMAGRWQQIQRVKQLRPWLVYLTVGDLRVRQLHQQWNKTALPVDDPWWDTHYPPNGWGCRCSIVSATEKQAQRLGAQFDDAPPINKTERVDTATGEVLDVPEGIDLGWDYNVGKAWLGADIAFGKRLMQLPAPFRAEVLSNNSDHIKAMTKSWQSWLTQRSGQQPRGYAHTVGYLPNDVIDVLMLKGIEPIGASIVVFDRQISHLVGEHKPPSKRIPPQWLSNLPLELEDYQAILLHKNDLVFVLKETDAGKNARAVIQVNFRRKGAAFNSLRSLGTVPIRNLKGKDYELIEGKL